MLTFTTEQLQGIVKDAAPGDANVAAQVEKIDFLPFSHLETSVQDDVKFLKENPLILPGTEITGWTYDVRSGKVSPTPTCVEFAFLNLSLLDHSCCLGNPSNDLNTLFYFNLNLCTTTSPFQNV